MKLLTIKEAADALRCDARLVHDLIDAGRLGVIELTASKRGRRVNPEALQEFMQGSAQKCQFENVAKNGRSTSVTAPLACELDELLTLGARLSTSKAKSARPSNAKKYPMLASSTP